MYCLLLLTIISNPASLDSSSTTEQFLPEMEALWYSGFAYSTWYSRVV